MRKTIRKSEKLRQCTVNPGPRSRAINPDKVLVEVVERVTLRTVHKNVVTFCFMHENNVIILIMIQQTSIQAIHLNVILKYTRNDN